MFVRRTVNVVLSKQLRGIECMSLLFLVLRIYVTLFAFSYLVDFFGYLMNELNTHFLFFTNPRPVPLLYVYFIVVYTHIITYVVLYIFLRSLNS